MFPFKLTAILLSLLARLVLSDPQFSILDESTNRWLPDDSLLTGLNNLYNSLSQGLYDNEDKKKRPASMIAAAIVEYLSSDLADEQARLNSAVNELAKRINSKSKIESSFGNKKSTNHEQVTRTPDLDQIERDSQLIGRYNEDLNDTKYYRLKSLSNDNNIKLLVINDKYLKYNVGHLTDERRKNRNVFFKLPVLQ